MKILIISRPTDTHAVAVSWGLRQLGCEVCLWTWPDFPIKQTSSIQIDNTAQNSFKFNADGLTHSAPFDVVWNRRRGRPTPKKSSHPDDLEIINRESYEYLLNSIDFLGHPDTLWVNTFKDASQTDHKTTQLLAAKEVGFKIPATLISNDIEDIKHFFYKHNEQIVFKAFFPGSWWAEEGDVRSVVTLRTSAISAEHLENEAAISACPGIFQELIEKEYELRVTVIGTQLFTGLIDSQAKGRTIDWRYDGREDRVPLRKFEISEDLSRQCLALCKTLGLAFGCIDLIVDKKGNTIFVEVNEAGQFLWKEEQDPSLPMLDAFCRFLSNADTSRNSDVPRIALSDFYETVEFSQLQALWEMSTKKS